jgi:hypothetical protein
MSIAWLIPMSRGSLTVPPSSSGTPQRRQNTPKTASRDATRKSHHAVLGEAVTRTGGDCLQVGAGAKAASGSS